MPRRSPPAAATSSGRHLRYRRPVWTKRISDLLDGNARRYYGERGNRIRVPTRRSSSRRLINRSRRRSITPAWPGDVTFASSLSEMVRSPARRHVWTINGQMSTGTSVPTTLGTHAIAVRQGLHHTHPSGRNRRIRRPNNCERRAKRMSPSPAAMTIRAFGASVALVWTSASMVRSAQLSIRHDDIDQDLVTDVRINQADPHRDLAPLMKRQTRWSARRPTTRACGNKRRLHWRQ